MTANNAPAYPFALKPGCGDGQQWDEKYFNPQHARLDVNDGKYADWLFKLGGMLRDQVLPLEHQGKTYFLKSFPRHYHLRVKTKDTRSDYYLYGYPGGTRPAVFRSPNEFFPHLLWIVGGSGDKSQCSCKLCTPIQTKPDWLPKERVTQPEDRESPSSRAPAAALSTVLSPQGSASAMKRTTSASGSAAFKLAEIYKPASPNPLSQKQVSQPAAAAAAQRTMATNPVPTLPGQSQASEAPTQQAVHAEANESFIFTEGEIVWYRNNNAWRIGLVLQARSVPHDYVIKPLGHVMLKLDTLNKVENDMRPFLAFSVPPVNMPELKGKLMHDINWKELASRLAGDDRHKQELLGLEASKMAVLEIDHSYSTFNAINGFQPGAALEHVGGVFIGAERVCTEEAVRVRLNQSELDPAWAKGLPIVMVVRDIHILRDADGESLHFSGDIYRLEETASQLALNQAQLPAELLREKAFRDGVKQPFGTHFEWILIQQNVSKPESVIRGRFYETEKLMPIIDPQKFALAREKGIVEDVQAYLNNRMDSNGPYIGRRKTRLETLSDAISKDFVVSFMLSGVTEST